MKALGEIVEGQAADLYVNNSNTSQIGTSSSSNNKGSKETTTLLDTGASINTETETEIETEIETKEQVIIDEMLVREIAKAEVLHENHCYRIPH